MAMVVTKVIGKISHGYAKVLFNFVLVIISLSLTSSIAVFLSVVYWLEGSQHSELVQTSAILGSLSGLVPLPRFVVSSSLYSVAFVDIPELRYCNRRLERWLSKILSLLSLAIVRASLELMPLYL